MFLHETNYEGVQLTKQTFLYRCVWSEVTCWGTSTKNRIWNRKTLFIYDIITKCLFEAMLIINVGFISWSVWYFIYFIMCASSILDLRFISSSIWYFILCTSSIVDFELMIRNVEEGIQGYMPYDLWIF